MGRVGHAAGRYWSMATDDIGACVADLQAIWPAVTSPLIQVFFGDARRWFASFPHAQAAAG
jgi:hypothetical protein